MALLPPDDELLTLSRLPTELLTRIFDYVPTSDLWRAVRSTSRRMRSLLSKSDYWLTRAMAHFDVHIPPRLVTTHSLASAESSQLELKEAYRQCSGSERAFRFWRTDRANCLGRGRSTGAQTHYGTIDAVHVFRSSSGRRLCLTGARDRAILVWDLEKVWSDPINDEAQWIATRRDAAHRGWIWSIASMPEHGGGSGKEFYSASWDYSIRQWHLREDGQVEEGRQREMQAAVLQVLNDGSPNLVYFSTYKMGPVLWDVRESDSGGHLVATLNVHRGKSVHGMATHADSPYIYSIGEDNRLVSVDKRMLTVEDDSHRAVVADWRPTGTDRSRLSHVACHRGYVAVSQRSGRLMFMDAKTLRTENEITLRQDATKSADYTGSLSMWLTEGATYASYDHRLVVYSSGLRPKMLASTSTDAPIATMYYSGGDLVASTGTGSLAFWREQE